MTVIAWDGKTLAADKQSTSDGYARIVTKIHRIANGLVGFTGDAIPATALLQWFRCGMLHDQWPKKLGDNEAYAVFIDLSGKVHLYCSAEGPYAEQLEDPIYAAGHGRDFALAAMYLGKSALEAVAVACALDKTCGKGIDTLELEGG